MLTYWVSMVVLFFVLLFLSFVVVWLIAKTDTFFGFIKEGQGALIKHGESFGRVLLSFHGHRCDIIKEEDRGGEIVEVRKSDGKVIGKFEKGRGLAERERWKIYHDEPVYDSGILGLLEEKFGIYWFGFYPFVQRMEYNFRWNEWSQKEEKGALITSIKHRELPTKFFYAQTFNYALILDGAETGGVKGADKEEIGGNVTVDLKIVLLLQIIYPQVAILQNENWFEQLGAVVLDHARLYVGSRPFEKLRSQETKQPEIRADDHRTNNDFCDHIMKLNKHAPIGEDSDSIIDAFGVKIVGAQIMSVELSGDSKKLAEVTTEVFTAQEKAKGIEVLTDAKAYEIREKGRAEADVANMLIEVVAKHGDVGKFVERQRALAKAGEGGNTIVFTSDSEKGGLNEQVFAGLILKGGKK